jgi:hypothetical protein
MGYCMPISNPDYKKRCDEVILGRGYDLKKMKNSVEGGGSKTAIRFTYGMTAEQILELLNHGVAASKERDYSCR